MVTLETSTDDGGWARSHHVPEPVRVPLGEDASSEIELIPGLRLGWRVRPRNADSDRTVTVYLRNANAAEPEEAGTPQAAELLQALKAQRYQGSLQFVSLHTRGTLADLMEIKADLGVIALPPEEDGRA